MSRRNTVYCLFVLLVINGGCTFIAKFDGRESHAAGSAGERNVNETAGSAGVARGGAEQGGSAGSAGLGTTTSGSNGGGAAGTASGSGSAAGAALAGSSNSGGMLSAAGSGGVPQGIAGTTAVAQAGGGGSAIGGAAASGGSLVGGGSGTANSGGTLAAGGTAGRGGSGGAAGGLALGGASPIAGAAGTGCTGGFESMQRGFCSPKQVTLGTGGAPYGIDATEVTRGQYDAWRLQNPPPAPPLATDVSCRWNSSYAPDATCMAGANIYAGANADKSPAVCVDWCDANAYCLGVGKRLCGARNGLSNDYTYDHVGQWYEACAQGVSGARYVFPYGNTCNAGWCVDSSLWSLWYVDGSAQPVGSRQLCASTVSVFDMSGNVREWEDACYTYESAGESAPCRLRGGAFSDDCSQAVYLECATLYHDRRDAVSAQIGFRCCSQ